MPVPSPPLASVPLNTDDDVDDNVPLASDPFFDVSSV